MGRQRLMLHLLYGLIGIGLPQCSSVLRVTEDEGPSLPGIQRCRGHRLRGALTRQEQQGSHPRLYCFQPSLQPYSKRRGRNSCIVGIATAVKDMECLRTTSSALQQLSLHQCLSCHVQKTGRKTHWVHRLSNALVATSFCLEPVHYLGSVPEMLQQIKQKNTHLAVDVTISFTRSIGELKYNLLVG